MYPTDGTGRLLSLVKFAAPGCPPEGEFGLAAALAGHGRQVLLLDLRPGTAPKRRRGSPPLDPSSLASAMTDPGVDLAGLAVPTRVRGLSALRLGDLAEALRDEREDWVAEAVCRLGDGGRTVVVENPPPIGGVAASRWVVVPSRDGECDVWGGLIGPLTAAGLVVAEGDAAVDVVGMTVLPAAVPSADEPDGRHGGQPDPERGLLQRTYHLRPSTVDTLEVVTSSLSQRLGRHIRKSRVVAWAIRYAPVLEHIDRVDRAPDLVQRTYHLGRGTVSYLSQVGVLASRVAGRHVRLSAVVDVAIGLFAEMPPQEQDQIVDWDGRRRPDNRAGPRRVSGRPSRA